MVQPLNKRGPLRELVNLGVVFRNGVRDSVDRGIRVYSVEYK